VESSVGWVVNSWAKLGIDPKIIEKDELSTIARGNLLRGKYTLELIRVRLFRLIGSVKTVPMEMA
jgi:hypothetical protein